MSQDTPLDAEQEEAQSEIVHDDIVKRLLEYQRQLREGMAADAAAETAEPGTTKTDTELVVDLTEAEAAVEARETAEEPIAEIAEPEAELEIAEPEAEAPEPTPEIGEPTASEPTASAPEPEPAGEPAEASPSADLEARVAELEASLGRVTQILGELRGSFQEMAIAADERLAELEALLASTAEAEPAEGAD
jgi:hypothetical protein